jgi:hypothetical protein
MQRSYDGSILSHHPHVLRFQWGVWMRRTFRQLFPEVVGMLKQDTALAAAAAYEDTLTKREHFALHIFTALIQDDDTTQVLSEKAVRAGVLADVLMSALNKQTDAKLIADVKHQRSNTKR